MSLKGTNHYRAHSPYTQTSTTYYSYSLGPSLSCQSTEYVYRRTRKRHHRHHYNPSPFTPTQSIDSHKHDKQKDFMQQTSLQQSSPIFQHTKRDNSDQNIELSHPQIEEYCNSIRQQTGHITSERLQYILTQLTLILKQLNTSNQQLVALNSILHVLASIQSTVPISTLSNDFFSMVQLSLNSILIQWTDLMPISKQELNHFHILTKFIKQSIQAINNIEMIPSWLFDSSLLTTIAHSLTFIANSPTIINQNNKHIFKYFIRLFDTYLLYQQRFASQHQSHKDSLNQLLQPIQQCLSSSHFIQIFTSSTSLTSIEKFFLRKCPAFILSYNGNYIYLLFSSSNNNLLLGSQLQQTMENLLESILPKYDQLLTSLLSNIKSWKKVTIENIDYLLQILNHGANHLPTNAKLVSNHLSLIDNVLKIVDEPILYNHLHENLSNIETSLMNSCVSFLVNMISDPTILAHIKQRQVANVFLRLTTCKYEPLVFNVYALLAYTTHEEDIKKMNNPGRLLATIIKSLKVTLKKMPNNHSHKEQLLETLKGLIQHDQIKDEVIKQNALPFLLECTDKLTDQRRILILEILWTLTFHEKSLSALRANSQFLEKIKNISKDEKNEPLKKAADGLVWKLVQGIVYVCSFIFNEVYFKFRTSFSTESCSARRG